MITKIEQYKRLIQQKTNIVKLFYETRKHKKQSIIYQFDTILQSSYPFRSSQQIQENIKHTNQILQQTTEYTAEHIHIVQNNQWPQSCIGLILCQLHQHSDVFYVYGTGILIHNNIVLTSAQNLYCRRLHKQYTNIRFITGLNSNKSTGIYEVRQIHYPKEYIMQQEDNNFNFGILQLYADLSDTCGYIGWRPGYHFDYTDLMIYIYIKTDKEGFKLQKRLIDQKVILSKKEIDKSNYIVVIKDTGNNYYVVNIGKILEKQAYITFSEQIKNEIDNWTTTKFIDLEYQNMEQELFEYIVKEKSNYVQQLNLKYCYINDNGCKKFTQTDWMHLKIINLKNNSINSEGCLYLSQVNWPNLTNIYLQFNLIDDEGCEHLKQANWKNLTTIYLNNNYISDEGCKHLASANWQNLIAIFLNNNEINAIGCQYLIQNKWKCLNLIDLSSNNLSSQGCKYLSQIYWKHLKSINLSHNNIDSEGCKYLRQTNWKYLMSLNLYQNNIGEVGVKYLTQTNWTQLKTININNNKILNKLYSISFTQLLRKNYL